MEHITLDSCPTVNIYDAFYKCRQHLVPHQHIAVSVSGGSDSDIMLDLILRAAKEFDIPLEKMNFIFFDTGIEYEATKKHLCLLEEKYGIKIEWLKAKVPVPLGCRKFGVPFYSKFVSEMISRLQRYDFDFQNDGRKEYEFLQAKYPKCSTALKWWCNAHGEKSRFNIDRNKRLKEFMIENPPTFKISPKCCDGAKKVNGKVYTKENGIDLNCIGIRRSENGVRSQRYHSCFSSVGFTDYYRPIFWFTDEDKTEYANHFGVSHSDCYTVYGLERTGCAGCPFGSKFEDELAVIKEHEPKLYTAVCNIFRDSYDYTREYRKFKEG